MNATTLPAYERLRTLTRSPQNGYLLYVPGGIIAAGSLSLPAPTANEAFKPERAVEVDVPDLGGKMRITFMLKNYRHHKTSTWAWTAVRADVV